MNPKSHSPTRSHLLCEQRLAAHLAVSLCDVCLCHERRVSWMERLDELGRRRARVLVLLVIHRVLLCAN